MGLKIKKKGSTTSSGRSSASVPARTTNAAINSSEDHTAYETSSLLDKAAYHIQPINHHLRSAFDEFQDFISQGSILDLAIGLILGRSFTAILNSFVVDILTPLLSLFSDRNMENFFLVARCPDNLRHCTSKTWSTVEQAQLAGATTINWGRFVENCINFITNALFLYIAIKKVFEWVFHRSIVMQKQCPICKDQVNGAALKCKSCGFSFPPT